MGITGLLPLLKKASRNCNVRKFSGYTVAIDGYCWLHKGAFGCAEKLGKGEPTTAYITYCMKYINVLLDNNIKPIIVLDGRNLPSKEHTEKKRREKREENRKLARKYLQEGNRKGAWECFTRCVDITPAMAREFIKELRRLNIDYVVAPHEADAQLAYMARKGIADMIITEDSDLVLFGCPKIFFKMNVNGDGVYFEDTKIPQSLGVKPNQYTFERFRWMCILSGCDYLPSIPGIGLGRAKKVIFSTTEEDITKIILSIPSVLDQVDEVPEGYIDGFIQAENTFLYQLVFDTITRTVIPLTPYPDTVNPEDLGYAGRYESKQLAIGLALGNVDLHNLNFVDNFEPLKSGYTNQSIWSHSFNPEDRPNVNEKPVSHSTTVGMQFSASISILKKKRPLTEHKNKKDENNIEDKELMQMYAAEKLSSKELSSDSDADDFKESSRHPSNAKRCRLSKTTTGDTECESPSGNTRSRGKTPFLKSPENVVAISKTKVLSKYFKPAQEEENGGTHIQIAKTKTSKLSVAEEEKINSAHVLLEKLPNTVTGDNTTSSQLSIYSLDSSGRTNDDTSQSLYSSSLESRISNGSDVIPEATIPEITLDDDDAEEDEAYGSGSASTTRSSTLSSSSSYFQRSSQSKSPGSTSIKTSSTKIATATTKSSCRRQGLARSVKKSSGPQQRSVRDMFPIKQSN